jgi:hypothetical protein
MSPRKFLFRRRYLIAAILLVSAPTLAQAQVTSQGRGQLTFTVGQGSGPLAGIATDVVDDQRTGSEGNLKHLGFRVTGGYQFADFFSFEAGLTHSGTFSSQAPYLATDQMQAQTSFNAVEADLVGKIPFAPIARLDLTLGAVETSLDTTLSTLYGSAIPLAQENPIDSRHFGVTIGADVELRLSANTSLIAGYHVYPGVGSTRLVGSASGTMSMLAAGVHFEF